jgi:hypothetical protein
MAVEVYTIVNFTTADIPTKFPRSTCLPHPSAHFAKNPPGRI